MGVFVAATLRCQPVLTPPLEKQWESTADSRRDSTTTFRMPIQLRNDNSPKVCRILERPTLSFCRLTYRRVEHHDGHVLVMSACPCWPCQTPKEDSLPVVQPLK